MPELPEVETSRRGIAPYLEGQIIQAIEVRNAHLRWPVPVAALQSLAGETISGVQRRGKYIKLVCTSGYILVHLGMSGSLRVVVQPEIPRKHDHVDLVMKNGVMVRFNDPRRFGCWLYQPHNNLEHPLLAALGPEPLQSAFNAEYLYAKSRKKTQPIKTFIMDSHVVVGVGNIYAAEALFRAGISPQKQTGKISMVKCTVLVDAIKAILGFAIKEGGTTLRNYINSEGKPGYFKQQLMVYGRQGEPCYQCNAPVKMVKQSQRSTFFCAQCQK